MLPFLVFSDDQGNVFSHPYLKMVVSTWDRFYLPLRHELVPKIESASFYSMPGRLPVGYNPLTGECEVVEQWEGKRVWAASVFMPPSYMRTANPACVTAENIRLPFFAYTPCGFYAGKFYAAAKRVDPRTRQLPHFYGSCEELSELVNQRIVLRPHNRMYKHFAKCALEYGCLAAKNLFYKRWEAPLVVSGVCNARCVGCLSRQDSMECTAPHQRIDFLPSPEELAQVALDHISYAREPILSFGQGCEGEPLLRYEIIAETLKIIRSKTDRGTLHLNSNASLPDAVELLAGCGLDSLRVSLNSVREQYYNKYFDPQGYVFSDVCRSIHKAKKKGLFVSLNLFVFPGFTDREDEIAALYRFIREYRIDMILLRNLNIDPQLYVDLIGQEEGNTAGLLRFVEDIKKTFPALRLGYFNVPVKKACNT